jgi:ribonuclease T2
MRRGLAALFAALVCAAAPPRAAAFDYYILALSWSPSFCASPGAARREPLQCGAHRGFIVHGLWPENEGGGWPSHCASNLPPSVALDVQRHQLDLTPSAGLIVHQWQTHGLCTGLAQRAYFDAIRRIRANVRIPPAFSTPPQVSTLTAAAARAAFVKANPGLRGEGLALECGRNALEEVRLCVTKDGAFRRCGIGVRDRCPSGPLKLPR